MHVISIEAPTLFCKCNALKLPYLQTLTGYLSTTSLIAQLKVTRNRDLLRVPTPAHTAHIIHTQRPLAPTLTLSRKAIVLLLLHPRLPVPKVRAVVLGAGRWQEVDEEREDVEGEDERDGPLENSGDVVGFLEGADGKGDSETEFEEDEGELDPEGGAEDEVLAVLDSQTLVLPADEDGRDDVSSNE